jgi:hypothetical protein
VVWKGQLKELTKNKNKKAISKYHVCVEIG